MEMGIPMALGAQPSHVTGIVLAETAVRGGAGVAMGVAGALAITRLAEKMLYGVSPPTQSPSQGRAPFWSFWLCWRLMFRAAGLPDLVRLTHFAANEVSTYGKSWVFNALLVIECTENSPGETQYVSTFADNGCAYAVSSRSGSRGQILGTITDSAGARVPGASIHVLNVNSGVESAAVSNDNGEYLVSFLLGHL